MIGKPKFKIGDKVKFKLNSEVVKGIVLVVDAYGIFVDDSKVYYDIEIIRDGHPVWIKHIPEDFVEEI